MVAARTYRLVVVESGRIGLDAPLADVIGDQATAEVAGFFALRQMVPGRDYEIFFLAHDGVLTRETWFSKEAPEVLASGLHPRGRAFTKLREALHRVIVASAPTPASCVSCADMDDRMRALARLLDDNGELAESTITDVLTRKYDPREDCI